MNRAFKREFHNGQPFAGSIVTMGVAVKQGARFKAMSAAGRRALVAELDGFCADVKQFSDEIKSGYYHGGKPKRPTSKPNNTLANRTENIPSMDWDLDGPQTTP